MFSAYQRAAKAPGARGATMRNRAKLKRDERVAEKAKVEKEAKDKAEKEAKDKAALEAQVTEQLPIQQPPASGGGQGGGRR